MIWAAIFLVCTEENCMSVGSPVFPNKEMCELSISAYGVNIVRQRYPNYNIVSWRCVKLFGDGTDV